MRTITTISKADVVSLTVKALKIAPEQIRWMDDFVAIGDEIPIAEIDEAPRTRKARPAKTAKTAGTASVGTTYRAGRRAKREDTATDETATATA